MGFSRRFAAPCCFAAAVAVSACGGGGGSSGNPATTAPTQTPTSLPTVTASATPTSAPTATPTPTSSPVAPTWTFSGSTTTMTATNGQAPALVSLSSYQNLAFTAQFATVVSGSGTIAVSDAINNGSDITPNTLPADNATTGTPMLYLSFYNGGSADISFGQNLPTLTMTDSAGYGTKTTCSFDVYSKNGGASPTWNAILNGNIAGNTVTIGPGTLPAGNTVDFKPGQQVVAISCK